MRKINLTEKQLDRIIEESFRSTINEGFINTDNYGQKSMFGFTFPWTKKSDYQKRKMRAQ